MNKKLFQIIFILFALIVFGTVFYNHISKQVSTHEDFAHLIQKFPKDELLRTDAIRITFKHGVLPVDNTELEESANKLFKFSPEIEGSVYWIDERTLEFRPNTPLRSNTTYFGKIHLDEILKAEFKAGNYKFNISTPKLNISYYTKPSYVIDTGKIYQTSIQGEIRSNDYIELSALKDFLVATQEDRNLPLTIIPGRNQHNFQFTVTNIKRNIDDSEIALSTLPNAPFFALPFSEKILASGNLSLLSFEEISEPFKGIKLNFSNPIESNQDLSSLITSDEFRFTSFTTDINTISVKLAGININSGNLIISKDLSDVAGNLLNTEIITNIELAPTKPYITIKSNSSVHINKGAFSLPVFASKVDSIEINVWHVKHDNILQYLQVNDENEQKELSRVAKPLAKIKHRLSLEPGWQFNKLKSYPLSFPQLEVPSSGLLLVQLKNAGKLNKDTLNYRKTYTLSNFNMHTLANGTDSLSVFIHDTKSGKPISGVNIKTYNYRQENIGTFRTNSKGYIDLERTSDLCFIVAENDNSFNYRNINYIKELKEKYPLEAFLSIYTPDSKKDSVFVEVVLKDKSLINSRAKLEWLNSKGNQIAVKNILIEKQHFTEAFNSYQKRETGYYTIKLTVNRQVIKKNFWHEKTGVNLWNISYNYGPKNAFVKGRKASFRLKDAAGNTLPNCSFEVRFKPITLFKDSTLTKSKSILKYTGKTNRRGDGSFSFNLPEGYNGKVESGLLNFNIKGNYKLGFSQERMLTFSLNKNTNLSKNSIEKITNTEAGPDKDQKFFKITSYTNNNKLQVGDSIGITLSSSQNNNTLVYLENSKGISYSFYSNEKMDTTLKIILTANMAPEVNVKVLNTKYSGEYLSHEKKLKIDYSFENFSPRVNLTSEVSPNGNFKFEIQEENDVLTYYSYTLIKAADSSFYNIDLKDYFNEQNPVLNNSSLALKNSPDIINTGCIAFSDLNQLEPNESRIHTINTNLNKGKLLLLVTCINKHSKGVKQFRLPIKNNQPILCKVQAPQSVSPYDFTTVTLDLINNSDAEKELTVNLGKPNQLSIHSDMNSTYTLKKGETKKLEIWVKIKPQINQASFNLEVKAEDYLFVKELTLPIKSLLNYQLQQWSRQLNSKDTWRANFNPFELSNSNMAFIEYSDTIPISIARLYYNALLFNDLNTEQRLKIAFPLLYLKRIVQLNDHQLKFIDNYVDQTIQQIDIVKLNQLLNQKLSYEKIYLLHFLLSAKQLQYDIDKAIINQLKMHLQNESYANVNTAEEKRVMSYLLYVLSEVNYTTLNRLVFFLRNVNDNVQAENMLAAALSKQENTEPANSLLNTLKKTSDNFSLSFQLLAWTNINNHTHQADLVHSILKTNLSLSPYAGMEESITLINLLSYYRQIPHTYNTGIEYVINNGKQHTKENEYLINMLNIPVDFSLGQSIWIKNNNERSIYYTLSNIGIPLKTKAIYNKTIKMQVIPHSANGAPFKIDKIKKHTPFVITVKLSNNSSNSVKGYLMFKIPAGWAFYSNEDKNEIWQELSLKSKQTKYLRFELYAKNKGTYSVPPFELYDINKSRVVLRSAQELTEVY